MGKGILIVDDAAFMRSMVRNILEKAGYAVAGEASNGLEAVRKYMELQPEVVTMDITMPEMDGVQAVKEIIKEYPNAKIIMCSAMGQQCLIMEAIRSGAKDFVIKPFQKDRVVQAIKRALCA